MEIFTSNEPRFCAQYVKHVGLAQEEKVGWTRVFKLNGVYYIRQLNGDFTVGQNVLIAKKIPLPGGKWNVHEIKLAEDFWFYSHHAKRTPKEKRSMDYQPRAKTWLGKTLILEEISQEYYFNLVKKYTFK